ncbi:hypothetical protein MUY14_02475 [Amycolatopsis sp. FBCC-B4732]|uniref:BadF/BadG/BcrA/BcrD ATPase family protein n=1 Tax=Amycolatopsis sp. FBCC-B4732 TaxID=3079339 RepID=UPI001FF3BA94|nr:BadF/BadG/BcrA/BcrD ATPase family protein [Amycolatopsis sp. FBCC-B4732]UOX89529.1 hypothetical protein MUY14_02475 [Amycolatopsis sp. FBCC-B4732]
MVGRFAIDAGGSRTRALVVPGDGGPRRTFELPSINPHATGDAAGRTLREAFAEIGAVLGTGPSVGWLASAAAGPGGIGPELERARAAADAVGLDAGLVVSNDVLPLLWGVPALSGVGVVAVCGTGSGFFGTDGKRVANAGGCEYLGSDEGGAVDIGLRGLRAAVRATDGRGPETKLVDALSEYAGTTVAGLARRLAAQPFPKQGLAALAPVICETWLAGDDVALGVIDQAVGDLAEGVYAVRDALGLPDGFAVAAAGGVFTGCPELYEQFAHHLTGPVGAGSADLVTDTASVVLTALDRFAGSGEPALPGGLDAYAAALPPRRRHEAGTVLGGVR